MYSTTEADALVLTGIVDGLKTLTVVFRGTDQNADVFDYANFVTDHYAKFAPLLAALKSYISNNSFDQILVDGHSLGGGVAQIFAADIASLNGNIKVFTFGSPGAEVKSTVPEVNIFHTTDNVSNLLSTLSHHSGQVADALTLLSLAGLTAAPLNALAALLAQIQPKYRSGSSLVLTSDINNGLSAGFFAGHNIQPIDKNDNKTALPSYVGDVGKLVDYAGDPTSPFSTSALGVAIAYDRVYTGADPEIALGNGTGHGGVMHTATGDMFVLGDKGANDTINWKGAPDANAKRTIDGGGGSNNDIVSLPTDYVWTTTPEVGFSELYASDASGNTVDAGSLYRIKSIVVPGHYRLTLSNHNSALDAGSGAQMLSAQVASSSPSDLVRHLDGTPTTVQTAANGASLLVDDGSADVVYGGPGVFEIDSSRVSAAILYGSDTNLIKATGAGSVIVADGTNGAAAAIDPGAADDVIYGGPRDETLIGRLSGVDFDGDGGRNTVDYSAVAQAVTIDLSNGLATGTSGRADVLSNVQVAIGSATIGSTLVAGNSGSFLVGGLGDDTFIAGSAADVFQGNGGKDTFAGAIAAFDGDSILDFRNSDVIDVTDIAPTALTAVYDVATGDLVIDPHVAGVSAARVALSLPHPDVAPTFLVGADGNGGSLVQEVACYCAGTLIETEFGDLPVEELEIGQRLLTASGQFRSIRWIGKRSYAGRFLALNISLWPVLIRAGALGNSLPKRDLRISPKHAMFIDGLLIQADQLVNGTTIVFERQCKKVEYYHVELDEHDILLAEGAASESFVDDDSRGMFQNATEWECLYPGRVRQPAIFCAPRVFNGPKLDAIRQRLGKQEGQAAQVA